MSPGLIPCSIIGTMVVLPYQKESCLPPKNQIVAGNPKSSGAIMLLTILTPTKVFHKTYYNEQGFNFRSVITEIMGTIISVSHFNTDIAILKLITMFIQSCCERQSIFFKNPVFYTPVIILLYRCVVG